MAKPGYYVSRVPVLSTAHVREATLARLLVEPEDSPVAVVAGYPEGCFLYLKAAAGEPDQSEDLRALYQWARQRHYHWIRLDADGDMVSGLPVYHW